MSNLNTTKYTTVFHAQPITTNVISTVYLPITQTLFHAQPITTNVISTVYLPITQTFSHRYTRIHTHAHTHHSRTLSKMCIRILV